jgi:hypothetical protein
MNFICIDVGRYIIDFLTFTTTIKDIFFINKWWNTLIKNSHFLQNYKQVKTMLNMYLEDSRSNNNEELLKIWNKYNNWKWPTKSKNITFKISTYVDVLDKVEVWCPAIIKETQIKVMNNVYEKKFKVEFLGWSKDFNEVVSIDKIKPLGTKYPAPFDLYENLKKQKEFAWVIYKKSFGWTNVKIKTMEVNKDHIICKMDGSLIKLNKEDVKNKLHICTNTTSVLCNKKNDLLFRNFKY